MIDIKHGGFVPLHQGKKSGRDRRKSGELVSLYSRAYDTYGVFMSVGPA